MKFWKVLAMRSRLRRWSLLRDVATASVDGVACWREAAGVAAGDGRRRGAARTGHIQVRLSLA